MKIPRKSMRVLSLVGKKILQDYSKVYGNIFFVLAVIFSLIFSTTTLVFSQTMWIKDTTNNPILSPGPPGSWDDESVGSACVILVGDTFHMWYDANIHPNSNNGIGHSTSLNGIDWSKDGLNPVLTPGAAGSWDSHTVTQTTVLFNNSDSLFHMWYVGWPSLTDPSYIGHATSPDGGHWAKDTINNPVLNPGPLGSWDVFGFTGPSVILLNDTLHMWYEGWINFSTNGIGHAISVDWISWQKDSSSNPVFNAGNNNDWDFPDARLPKVIHDGFRFHMFYAGGAWFSYDIGYAYSQDGINWTKYNDPLTTNMPYIVSDPVLKKGQVPSWDDDALMTGSVLFNTTNDSLKMWYSGAANGITTTQIGLATSPYPYIHVPGDAPTIQAGIDSASDGNIVLVEDGTYLENINFKGKAITVASHYYIDGDTNHINNTIIDGSNPSNADSGSVVSFISGEDTTSVLYGFTITNGTGTIVENSWLGTVYTLRAGGGILCYDSGARISHNKILNNDIPHYADSDGGGIAGFPIGSTYHVIIEGNLIISNTINGVYTSGGGIELTCNGTIINNDISSNTCNATTEAWGGAIDCFSEPTVHRNVLIKNNRINRNTANGNSLASGGGVTIALGMNASVIDNEIFDNVLNATQTSRGGGIFVSEITGTIIIDRNTISNNENNGSPTSTTTGGGICLWNNSNTLITNNIISGNSVTLNGGGIHNRGSKTEIINNTIVNNTATQGGGIQNIIVTYPKPIIMNTIIWGNQAGTDPQISGDVACYYSDVEGGYEGEGNVSKNPMLRGENFVLSDSSSCIGAGIGSFQYGAVWYVAPGIDRWGNPRPNPPGTNPDMGACESPLDSPIVSLERQLSNNLPKSYDLKQNYPNPFNITTTIEFDLPKNSEVTLKVFNILGEEVVTLVSDRLSAGSYSYDWDASKLASGVYLYKLQAGNYTETKKTFLIR